MTTLERVLIERGTVATKTDLDRAVADIIRRTARRESGGGPPFSLSQMIRGMAAQAGNCLNDATREADVQFTRTLTTGATTGSYLVPTFQADEIIGMLSIGGVARAAGARIIPINNIHKLTIPSALTSPTWEWLGQASSQALSDASPGQTAFDLKTRRCLTAVPNELLKSSVPAFDTLISQVIAQAAAEHEDTALFATTTVSGGPTAFMSTASITTLNAASNGANGGNLLFTDILAVLAKTTTVKSKSPYVWFMSGRTWWQRVLGMLDLQSRPLAIPTMTQGLAAAVAGYLMGWPVFITPAIPENEAVGSGTNQSHAILVNPSYLLIAQDNNLEIAVSSEFLFSSNQTAIRAVHGMDAAVAPPQGLIALKGIN